MNKLQTLLLICCLLSFFGCKSQNSNEPNSDSSTTYVNTYEGEKIEKSEEDWRNLLDEQSYYVIREKGTERSFTGDLLKENREGTFICKACELPLFSSETKFKSGTGWPSFYEPIEKSNIASETDYVIGYPRTEVMCARCDGHLGHVFDDGPAPTGLRYCINSLSLLFQEGNDKP